jgi:hypothetical protein
MKVSTDLGKFFTRRSNDTGEESSVFVMHGIFIGFWKVLV